MYRFGRKLHEELSLAVLIKTLVCVKERSKSTTVHFIQCCVSNGLDLYNYSVKPLTLNEYLLINVMHDFAYAQVIAKRLTEAKQSIPHYYLTVDIELDALMKHRAELNATLAQQAAPGTKPLKISVNDIVIKAMALANKAVPDCNSSWMGNTIRR